MANKLLLNALKAKIVSNPFAATPQGGQQDDSAGAGTGAAAMGDFHLTPTAGQPTATASPPPASSVDGVSPSLLAPPGELNLKALAPETTPPAIPVDSAPAVPTAPVADALKPIPTAEPVGQLVMPTKTEPALAPVAASDAVVFPQLTLETDHEAEELSKKVKALEGQKRKLVFKRYMPRVAGFAVLALASVSFAAFPSTSMNSSGKTTQANLVEVPKETPTSVIPETISPIRYFLEVSRACPAMTAEVRSKLQGQLREETNGLTINESIAYWVFACNLSLEAYVDRGFGPWAVQHGIVEHEADVQKPLSRPVMQKIFAAQP